jgi:TP901 family phage tail tape measure protein
MAQAGINSNGFKLSIGTTIDQGQLKKCKTDLDNFRAKAEKDGKINITINYNKAKGTKTQIEQITQATGEFAKVVSKLNSQGEPLEQTIISVGSKANNATKGINSLNSSLNNLNSTGQRSKSIFQDFTDTFMKMAKFNTINLIYDSITNSISEAIEITNEFNRATTELKKVSDLSGESLSEYTKQLSEYGEAVGRTMTEMTDSATIFKRTGSTDEEAAQLAQISELYKNVADSEITSAEASSFLVSQMKAFNYTAEQSIHVIDSVNSVANHFAVSTDDLQTALSKSAAAMATAGNSFEETIALVEAGTAIMQGQAGTVGNGLRTIAINIASLATESDEFVAANGKVNISLKNERGEIRSTYEILNDLAKNWNNLSTAEQNSIAVTLAGKHKYKSLVLPALNLFNCSKCLITL